MKRLVALVLVASIPLASPAPADAQQPPKPTQPAPKPPKVAIDKTAAKVLLVDLQARATQLLQSVAQLETQKATWKHDLAAAAQIDRRLIGLEKGAGGPPDPSGGTAEFKPIFGPPSVGPVLAAIRAACEGFGERRYKLRGTMGGVTKPNGSDAYARYPDLYRDHMKQIDLAFSSVLTATDVKSLKESTALVSKSIDALSEKISASK